MDNPEKPATHGTQDDEKLNKSTTQYVLDTTTRVYFKRENDRKDPYVVICNQDSEVCTNTNKLKQKNDKWIYTMGLCITCRL
jgi:hypothetical protein